MAVTLSPFSQWALDDARTAEEHYLIFLICEDCRILEYQQLPMAVKRRRIFKRIDHQLHKKLHLNPLLKPKYGVKDTERAAAMAPFLIKFAPSLVHDRRRIGEAGAVLGFFPALEEVALGNCDLRDLSFVEALPVLRSFQICSAVLEDLGPLSKCAALRHLNLGFTGSQYPCLTPPLYWVDAGPLGALQELESLTIQPNGAILTGLRFPALHSAELGGGNCVQRDCEYLPEMPALRVLKLEGPQSLRGIGRFPELRDLRIAGPLRDFGGIAELKHLSCLDVQTLNGWPTDVTPLTEVPELRWVNFNADIPRNYWPLTSAPRLCEVQLQIPLLQETSVALDVQAINAVLCPWDEVFHLPELRPRGKLRFVAVCTGGDTSVLPRHSAVPGSDYLAHPRLFHLEVLWMQRRAQAVLGQFGGCIEDKSYNRPSDVHRERSFNLEIQTISAAQRLPELLEALREVMAASPHGWSFQIYVNLRITKLELTPQQKKWLEEMEANSRNWDEERDTERWSKTQQHLIETQFRLRTSKEEGETPNPEDFEPPAEILPEDESHRLLVPAGSGSDGDDPEDEEEEEHADFDLKPYDEQEQDSGDEDEYEDDDDDNPVQTAPSPEPPEDFLEDPYAHPLAESYRFFATLTFGTFYYHGNNLGTVMQLMGRAPDEYHAAPDNLE